MAKPSTQLASQPNERETVMKRLRKALDATRHNKFQLSNNINNTHLPSTSREMALIDPLLKTTGSPIWVHPLLWGLGHLDRFGISVQHINSPITDPLRQKQTISYGTGRHLGGGSIGSRDLKYILQDINLLEIYLAGFLLRTINTFQKSLRSKPFRFFSQE